MQPTFADIGIEGVMALSLPILALLIPIIAVMTKHQQKMAEIIHGGSQTRAELDAVQAEVHQLRAMVQHQAQALNELRGLQPRAEAPIPSEPNLRINQ